jgi:hypothetical protein
MNETDPKVFIDHKNHNGLDCQKHNMRKCTISENNKNVSPRKNNSSQYIGVNKRTYKQNGLEFTYWYTQIRNNNKNIYLGLFPFTKEGEIMAAKKRDKVAKELHGEFANLNFK